MSKSEALLLQGDSLEVLKDIPDNSVDSIVTDPPYGLSFMGKKWDYDVPSVDIWKECLRVLKPGGHLLAFFGTRTYHRGVVRIEDAGFEIRDQIMWIYGSGFPKSMDISKQIDKAAGAEREVIGVAGKSGSVRNAMAGDFTGGEYMSTAPATDAAKKWQGYGTALKPANEPIVLARKPLEKGLTVAQNVLKWGVGGLNIDGSRIGTESIPSNAYKSKGKEGCMSLPGEASQAGNEYSTSTHTGRWPANIIFDEDAAQVLGEPSRFFYVAKASKRERNAGLEGMPKQDPPGSKRSTPAEGRKSALGEARERIITPQ